MKKLGIILLALALAVGFTAANADFGMAKDKVQEKAKKKKYKKFGADERAKAWKNKKWKTSKKRITWRMTGPWGAGLLFYDFMIHFADSVRAASGGRLNIKVFPAGAIVPPMETFEAVSKGVVDIGHSWPGYWKGKNEAFVAFSSVPFGLDNEGYNIWYYERGGQEMLNELYGRFGMVAFFCGNAGQELGLFSNKKASKMEDFKGMKVRTVGWYMDILNRLGASVTPLPGSEIYLGLERGIIDACEFSSPAVDLPMGFHEVTKYVIEPGAHQPSCQFDIFINKKKWDALPEDLKAIVSICAKETQLWSNAWIENLNITAIKEMGKKVEYVVMEDEALNEFAKTTYEYLEELKAKNPDVKKVLDSQDKFKEDFAPWREMRGRLVPWPYKTYTSGSQKSVGTHLQ
ncbi:TRAP transporter substrate-binding protein [Dethiosulfatarculus sandiegensis]|uniref:ABC transporter substrate-binding protein n=1 Tax=Dethiosulfatarculus sandiegensis TaxID=1429043 RepID=A0A0D2J7L1_9BACT|nr:TRAP transporter substrate-binding protein DctP [Dethiosulfatarculus sandiegensis]KIX14204.1 ABC transporter substrate-binding protein [Dethiosulfatarculus sandiegensis]